MRDLLRSVLVGAYGLPAVLLAVAATAAPATASTVLTKDVGPQRSATPNVTAEIGYARATVHPGDQDTMTVSLINHGPQSLDDHTSVHITVTMPQDADVSSNVVETIPGNAPTGSSNAVPSTRSVPVTQVFVRSAPGFFDVVVPAGSFGNSTSFRTYTFTLRISPTAPQGTELIGGGVAVALENYVGLTVEKSVVPPPPVVVVVPKTPSTPHKPSGSGGKPGGKSGGSSGPKTPVKTVTPVSRSTAGSSERTQRWTGTLTWTGCSGDMGSSGSGSGGSGQCACPGYQNMHGNGGGGSSSTGGSAGGSGGVGTCPCPVDSHMSAPSGGSGNSGGGSGTCGCPVDSHMSAPSGGSGGTGGTGGPVKCGCPVDQQMGAPSSGSGVPCTAGGLAATGGEPTWPLAIGALALAGGAALLRVARSRNWSRP